MKEEINYNLRISIKAICMYEDLTGKPFSKCFDDPENIIPLIYCILFSHPENKIHNTYQECLPLLSNEKILDPIAVGIKREIDILKQFESHHDTQNNETIETSDTSINDVQEVKDVFMKDIVPLLVSDCGLDINYVMNEMNYTDVDSFIKYRELKKEDEMETQRFWTYLTILPHIGSGKLKKPEDLIKFPWEKTEANNKFNNEIDDVKQKLKEIGVIKEEEESE